MPKPKSGEDKKSYISRFMGSSEAKSDFPDEKQRVAVAYSMWEKRNSTLPYGQEFPWPKAYRCTFIEPGVVFYQDLGACKICGDKFTCGNSGDACQPEGSTVLVGRECLESMGPSFVGKPVIDKVHEDVSPSTIADGNADGIVTREWLDDKTGWRMCDFIVWNPETQKHCEDPAYSVSCAYEPTDVNTDGGEYHNIPYSEDIRNGEYTHLAIVTSPRYEAARIFVNSKGDKMSWRFWQKGARKNAAPLDPLKTMVDVDGEKVPLKNLYDAHKEEAKNKADAEAKKAEEAPTLNDDTVLDNDGAETTLGELKQAYRNMAKCNADKACPTCGESKKNAEDGEKTPLPDLRAPKHNDQAEEAAKKLEKETEEKKALELEQKKNSDDAAAARDEKDMAEAAAMKNADAKAKEDEEKKNASDAEAKEAEEKKNADAKELLEKRNAGRRSFASLRNAREEHSGEAVKINPVSVDERLAKGRAKYGSA